jgi:hypothetical protein
MAEKRRALTKAQKRIEATKVPTRSSQQRAKSFADPEKAKRYVPLHNTARQYRDVETGTIISRNQRDKAVLPSREGGRVSKEQLAKRMRARGIKSHRLRYDQLVELRQDRLRAAGVKASKREIQQSKEMKDLVRDLRSKDKTLRGRKHRALVQLGLRDPNSPYVPGESPKTTV